MGKKTRDIVVNGRCFVYWYAGGLNVSPKDDQDIRVRMEYHFPPPEQEPRFFWRYESLSAVKDNAEVSIDVFAPKFVAEMTKHLLSCHKHLFEQKEPCPHVLDISELLCEMGYDAAAPKWRESLW